MRSLITAVAAGLVLAAPANAATLTVRIVKDGFRPASVTVTQDDTVRWVNADSVSHQVVAEDGSFASPVLKPGKVYRFTFRAAGTFRYHDALEPAEKGKVVVKGRPPAVSIGASEPIVRFGDTVHLTGTVSSGNQGEPVTIVQQRWGDPAPVQLAVAVTGAGGTFDVAVQPGILTSYRATYKEAASQPVSVQVRPRLRLLPYGRRSLKAQVTGARSFAGHWVYLQRRSRFGQWVNVRKLKLGQRSGRVLRISRRNPGLYRVYMTVNQAGAGYLDTWSGTQRVRAR